jgi:hypothetical protein
MRVAVPSLMRTGRIVHLFALTGPDAADQLGAGCRFNEPFAGSGLSIDAFPS